MLTRYRARRVGPRVSRAHFGWDGGPDSSKQRLLAEAALSCLDRRCFCWERRAVLCRCDVDGRSKSQYRSGPQHQRYRGSLWQTLVDSCSLTSIAHTHQAVVRHDVPDRRATQQSIEATSPVVPEAEGDRYELAYAIR